MWTGDTEGQMWSYVGKFWVHKSLAPLTPYCSRSTVLQHCQGLIKYIPIYSIHSGCSVFPLDIPPQLLHDFQVGDLVSRKDSPERLSLNPGERDPPLFSHLPILLQNYKKYNLGLIFHNWKIQTNDFALLCSVLSLLCSVLSSFASSSQEGQPLLSRLNFFKLSLHSPLIPPPDTRMNTHCHSLQQYLRETFPLMIILAFQSSPYHQPQPLSRC